MAYGKQWRVDMGDGTVVTRSNTWSPPGSHPVGYGVKVVVKDGKLVRIEGDDDNPITTGRVNAMNLALREYTYAPSRVIYPMKRLMRIVVRTSGSAPLGTRLSTPSARRFVTSRTPTAPSPSSASVAPAARLASTTTR